MVLYIKSVISKLTMSSHIMTLCGNSGRSNISVCIHLVWFILTCHSPCWIVVVLNSVDVLLLEYDQRSLAVFHMSLNEFQFSIYEKYKLYIFLKMYLNLICLWNRSLKIMKVTLPESTTCDLSGLENGKFCHLPIPTKIKHCS